MPRQEKTSNLAGTAVQDVEQDTFALLHSNWLTVAEHLSINREGVVANLIPVRVSSRERGVHRALPRILKRRHGLRRRQKVHHHIPASAEGRLELFHGQKDFAVIVPWIFLRLDIDRPNESAV